MTVIGGGSTYTPDLIAGFIARAASLPLTELWRRWIEALCARDLSRLDELAEEIFDQDSVVHSPMFPDVGRGPDGAKALARQVVADFSHVDITTEDFFGEDDKTVVRITLRSTSAATGKTVSFPALTINRWVGDKIAEGWELYGPPEEQA